ncbi:hypothetical protein [Brevundimonas sp. GCM10030266]|uniref:hypothetical protein n=1 Tax=Brevundimonas sp. GCM10030266 TaxID=3273386 RepID=UPI003606AF8D
MKSTVLKGAFLIFTMVGCEAEAPAITREAREDLKRVATRAERAIEESGDAAEAPVCRRAERVIYACDFGERRVAVCAAEDRLSYRFGTDRRTDLEIDSRPGRLSAHSGGVVGGGGGRQEHIRFSNNGYQYIVHSMVAGNLTDVPGKRISGVTVVHGETGASPLVRTLNCPQAGVHQSTDAFNTLPARTFTPETDETWQAWW